MIERPPVKYQDTHCGRGGDRGDCADRDRLLGVTQVPRSVGARHDTCEWESVRVCQNHTEGQSHCSVHEFEKQNPRLF